MPESEITTMNIVFRVGGVCILNYLSTIYPPYRPGDTVWLHKPISTNGKNGFPLARYVVKEVAHVILQDPGFTITWLEVVVKKFKEREIHE